MSRKLGKYWGTMFGGDMLYYNVMNLAVIFTVILFWILPFYVTILLIILEVMFTKYLILKRNHVELAEMGKIKKQNQKLTDENKNLKEEIKKYKIVRIKVHKNKTIIR